MNFHKTQLSQCPYSFSLNLNFALRPSLTFVSHCVFVQDFKPVDHEVVPDQMCACILFLSSLIKHFNACSDFQIPFASSPSSFSSEPLSTIITSCCSRRTVFSHSITRPFHIFLPVAISSVVTRCDTDWKIYRVFVQEVLGMGSSVLKTDIGSSTAISINVCKSSHHLMIEIWILDKLFIFK